MKKLEPILKQKFWILLGMAVIMTLAGWYLDTSKMVQAINTRKGEIEKAKKLIPKDKIPAESWAARVGQINERQKLAIEETKTQPTVKTDRNGGLGSTGV